MNPTLHVLEQFEPLLTALIAVIATGMLHASVGIAALVGLAAVASRARGSARKMSTVAHNVPARKRYRGVRPGSRPLAGMKPMRLVSGGVVAATLLTGCAARDEAERPNAAAASPVVTITATDYGYEAPDTIPAGFTVFSIVNRGDHGHAATIVRLEGGRTLPEYIAAYREANRVRGERPAWATFLGGPGALSPGDSHEITSYLDPGNYALVCFVPGPNGTSHLLEHNQAHAFVVRPRGDHEPVPAAPEPTVTLQMFDYSFQLSAPLQRGRQVIRVENAGTDPHHVLLFRLAPGKTLDDYQAWMNEQQGEPPATLAGVMGELSSGRDAFFEVDLTAGEYVLVCFVAGQDEVPHAAKGMIQHVRIE